MDPSDIATLLGTGGGIGTLITLLVSNYRKILNGDLIPRKQVENREAYFMGEMRAAREAADKQSEARMKLETAVMEYNSTNGATQVHLLKALLDSRNSSGDDPEISGGTT